MNSDIIEGKWDQLKGKVREKWGKLTDSDMQMIQGKKEQLIGKLQERYGYAKDQAQNEVDMFLSADDDAGCGCGASNTDKGGKASNF
jgi:uncharacterized protein YjbJ (UPF0337 family)